MTRSNPPAVLSLNPHGYSADWWAAVRQPGSKNDLPPAALPLLIESTVDAVTLPLSAAVAVLRWACALPGWTVRGGENPLNIELADAAPVAP